MSFKFNVGQRVRVVDVITENFSRYLGQVGTVYLRVLQPPHVPDAPSYHEYFVKFRDLPEMVFEEYELERYIEPFREEEVLGVQGI